MPHHQRHSKWFIWLFFLTRKLREYFHNDSKSDEACYRCNKTEPNKEKGKPHR